MNSSSPVDSSIKKFLVLCFFIIFTSTFALAQLNQGVWLVGGSGKYYNYKSKYNSVAYIYEGKFTQIDISPNVGYFVAEKLAFGLKPTFSSIKGRVTTQGGGYTNIQRYWIGPFARYYFLSSDRQTNIVADVSYQFGLYQEGSRKGMLRTFSAFTGPVIFFNSSVALELLLGYNYTNEDVKGLYVDSRSGFQFSLGFQIHLEK